jgi:hypothetical protein
LSIKAGPIRTTSLALSAIQPERCVVISVATRKEAWRLLVNHEAIQQGAPDWEVRGGKLCIGSQPRGIHIARSGAGLASVRLQFARR